MNREHWKAMLPIITAWTEGRVIQVTDSEKVTWWDLHAYESATMHFPPDQYRIKPEPKLRPWKPEEVPVGEKPLWIKSKDGKIKSQIVEVQSITVWCGSSIIHYDVLLEDWTLLDGSPCGVEGKR